MIWRWATRTFPFIRSNALGIVSCRKGNETTCCIQILYIRVDIYISSKKNPGIKTRKRNCRLESRHIFTYILTCQNDTIGFPTVYIPPGANLSIRSICFPALFPLYRTISKLFPSWLYAFATKTSGNLHSERSWHRNRLKAIKRRIRKTLVQHQARHQRDDLGSS